MIFFFISSCSSNIYDQFDEPILVDNILKVNDSLLKRSPVKFLIQPSPNNNFFGYPLGIAIYNLAEENPDQKFNEWLEKKPKRINSLEKVFSSKQVNQIKRYNNSFNKFLKNLGQEPIKISSINFKENADRLKQYYNSEGYFDAQINYNTTIDSNKAIAEYNVETKERYLIDSITIISESKDINSIIDLNKESSLLKEGDGFTINKLVQERDRLFNLFRNSGIENFQQRSLNYNVFIDSTGVNKNIPLIINITNPNPNVNYQLRKINEINIGKQFIQRNYNQFRNSNEIHSPRRSRHRFRQTPPSPPQR